MRPKNSRSHPLHQGSAVFWFFLLSLSFLFYSGVSAKNPGKWFDTKIDRVLNHQQVLLLEGKMVEIAGVEMPEIYQLKSKEGCYNRKIYRSLKILLEGEKIKVFIPENKVSHERGRHIKREDKRLLSEILLRRGLGKLDPQYEKTDKFFARYKAAEKEAQINNLGLWKGCDKQKENQQKIFLKGQDKPFYKKYHLNLSNISVGNVKKIISGNEIELRNGLKLKLIGVGIPKDGSEEPVLACFEQQAKKYLESFLVGKKVFLVRDKTQRDASGALMRYVYLPQNKYQTEVFLNQKIIEDGYGKFFPTVDPSLKVKNNRFDRLLQQTQHKIYQKPKGAWDFCLKNFKTKEQQEREEKAQKALEKAKIKAAKKAKKLAEKQEKERQKALKKAQRLLKKQAKETAKKLQYEADHPLDPACLVKGNISGSRKSPIKKYHTRYSRWYKRLQPERCFEDEKSAEKSGFIKVR